MAKKSNYSKLAQFSSQERARMAQNNPTLLQGLTPTQIAELFPDYFKRGLPDVGGFREAISRETAKRQELWQKSVDARMDQQGGMLSRMRKEYGGGNYGSTPASGNLKQNQQEAYKAARAEGLSDKAAKALVANMSGEGLANPGAVNKDYNSRGEFVHIARGIVQWDPQRSESIRSHFGKYPNEMTVAEQTKAAIWEMKSSNDPRLKQTWSILNDSNASPDQMIDALVRKYERSAFQDRDINTRMGFYNGLKIDEAAVAGTVKQDDQKKGQTPGQEKTATTPSEPGADTTRQAGQKAAGSNFNVVSNYIVPNDKSLYDTRNASQCATLSKAFNPSIGRSSGWSIVDGEIKPGVVVATKQYNNPGADKVHSGYHTGVALTAPNEKGDFLLLEQYNGSGGARTRWVNKDNYPIGQTGKTTSFGLISSGGKVHDEVSQEALAYGEKLGTPAQVAAIGTNSGTPGTGGDSAPGVEGEVEYTGDPEEVGGATVGEGEQQSASLMRPVTMMQNLMSMTQGMMGGQTATPLGLITTAMGFIMPIIGSIAGERLSGEGMGDGRMRRRKRGHRNSHGQRHALQRKIDVEPKTTTQSIPSTPIDNSPISHRADIGQMSVKYESGGRGVASISSGRKDPGGVSYGEHQLASKKGTMTRYLQSPEAKNYAEKFSGLKPGSAEFNKVYKQLAKDDPKGFAKSQQDFITRTHYEPIYRHAKALGYNVDDPRVQEALYSISVQHGGAKQIVNMAKSSTGSNPEKQVESLFGARRQYVASKGMNFDTRYNSEKREIMAMDVKKYKQDEMPTQVATAEPKATTPAVSSSPATPGAATGVTTAMAQPEKTFMQKVFPSSVAGEATRQTQTPSTQRVSTATTPSTQQTEVRATTIPNPVAPAAPIAARETRIPFGIYANPRPDMMHQFGYKKTLDSATVMPQTNVPAVTATTPNQTLVTSMPQRQSAPGPAPDITSSQISQMRSQMEVMSAATPTQPSIQMPPIQNQSPITHVLNHDHTMKMIQNPVDNPSAHRAFARAFGNETPGSFGETHFNYGNAK